MRRTLPLAIVATALLVAGCGGEPEPQAGDNGATAQPAGFPVTVGDLTLPARPDRIVSLCPTATEMLFAIDAGPQVVAVDEFSDYPSEAPTTDLSGFNFSAEAVAGHDPDLVVICSGWDEISSQLDTLDIPLHLTPDTPESLEDVYGQITDLGALTGHAGEAEDLVTRMAGDIEKLAADVPERQPLTYFIEIDDALWTYTSRSVVSVLFEAIGLENIAQDADAVTTQLSPETLVEANPDVILLADAQYGQTAEAVSQRDGWAEIAAVRSGQIVELSPDLHSRWGPRLVDLLAEVADATAGFSG